MSDRTRRLLALLGACGLLVASPWIAEVRGDRGERPLTQRQMKRKMRGWARALDVKCSYCHVKQGRKYDYEADTPHKAVAKYCNEHFVAKLRTEEGREIECATCHDDRRQLLPEPEDGDWGHEGFEDPDAEED